MKGTNILHKSDMLILTVADSCHSRHCYKLHFAKQ